jgi:hypothetical protein
LAANAQEIKDRLRDLKSERGTYDSHIDEIVQYLIPFRQRVTSQNTLGQKTMDFIMDSTPTHSLLLFAAGLCGLLTNASVPWYAITTENDDLMDNQDVKRYIDIVKQTFDSVLNKSNFYNQIHEVYLDLGSFGTGLLFVGEHHRHLCYFKAISPAQTYIGENRYDEIDTLYRVFRLTARQMVHWWGIGKVSEKVQEAAKSKPFETFEIIHAVYPRKDRDPGKIDKLNKPYVSAYVESEAIKILVEDGYDEFPYMVPRFFVMSGETYGRGPGMLALPDVKMLNRMEKDILASGQKKLNPPLLLPNDGFVGQLKLVPGAANFFRADSNMQEKIGTFPVADDLGYAEEKLEQKRNQIRSIFYNDMLQLVQDADMTATEFLKRAEEKLRLLGPLEGRTRSDLFSPMFDRIFSIFLFRGVLPPPPRVLWGENLKIDYISPLAKAQRTAEVESISRTIQMLGMVGQVKPEVFDNFDLDEISKAIAEINGLPSKLILSDDQVKIIREARAQQLAAHQQAAMLSELGKQIPNLSKEPGKGSPMEAIMGMGQEQMQ